tara:strand:+ start:1205 stop:1513 length:309 start_codon:yes stop_codon:yes gene_type:complete
VPEALPEQPVAIPKPAVPLQEQPVESQPSSGGLTSSVFLFILGFVPLGIWMTFMGNQGGWRWNRIEAGLLVEVAMFAAGLLASIPIRILKKQAQPALKPHKQ